MGRPGKATRPYEMRTHRTRGYTYAATVDYLPATAEQAARYRWQHWGTLDERLRFTPNASFLMLSPEERGRMIFPETWDVSALRTLPGTRGRGRPPGVCTAEADRFYGDVWLCEQLSAQLGLSEDLLTALGGSCELRDEILTLAIYMVCAGSTHAHVGEWQELEKTPAERTLTPLRVTRLTQSITAEQVAALLRCRARRQGPGTLLAVDSTTRRACGRTLTEVALGRSKEGGFGLQSVEVVGYSLRGHQPLYYRTFPGNMPDVRTMTAIIRDLEAAGFHDTVLVTDRGYESRSNLLTCIRRGQKLITAVSVTRRHVLQQIRALEEIGMMPRDMDFDPRRGLCLRQYSRHELGEWIAELGLTARQAGRLQLTLGLDLEERLARTIAIYTQLQRQGEELAALRRERELPHSCADLQRDYPLHDLTFSASGRRLTSYAIREQRLERRLLTAGFFALVSWGVAGSAAEIMDCYHLRLRQERYFARMKGLLGGRTQRVWSEAGRRGRELVLFTAGIILSRLDQVRSAELCDDFDSVRQLLNVMRRIRCVEHVGSQPYLTPFVGDQIRICQALGVEIPAACAPGGRA